MPPQRHLVQTVHAGAAKGPVGSREARRLDDMGFNAQAGGEAKNRAGVLGNVRLEKRDPHRGPALPDGAPGKAQNAARHGGLCEFWTSPRWRTCTPPSRLP